MCAAHRWLSRRLRSSDAVAWLSGFICEFSPALFQESCQDRHHLSWGLTAVNWMRSKEHESPRRAIQTKTSILIREALSPSSTWKAPSEQRAREDPTGKEPSPLSTQNFLMAASATAGTTTGTGMTVLSKRHSSTAHPHGQINSGKKQSVLSSANTVNLERSTAFSGRTRKPLFLVGCSWPESNQALLN